MGSGCPEPLRTCGFVPVGCIGVQKDVLGAKGHIGYFDPTGSIEVQRSVLRCRGLCLGALLMQAVLCA